MAMQFSKNTDTMDVRYVAALARMPLSDGETAALQAQLNDILAYIGELKALDVDGVEETIDASGNRNAWREDVPQPGLTQAEALANAPAARDGQFVVPKILE